MGQQAQILLPPTTKAAGTYQLQTAVDDLGTGTYYLVMLGEVFIPPVKLVVLPRE